MCRRPRPAAPQVTSVRPQRPPRAGRPRSAGYHPVASYDVLSVGTVAGHLHAPPPRSPSPRPPQYTYRPGQGQPGQYRPASCTGDRHDHRPRLAPPRPPHPPASARPARTSTSLELAWNAASDNVGVVAVRRVPRRRSSGTVSGTTLTTTVTGLTPAPRHLHREGAGRADNASPACRRARRHHDDQAGPASTSGRLLRAVWHLRPPVTSSDLDTSGSAPTDVVNYPFRTSIRGSDLSAGVPGRGRNPQDPDQGTGAGGNADARLLRSFPPPVGGLAAPTTATPNSGQIQLRSEAQGQVTQPEVSLRSAAGRTRSSSPMPPHLCGGGGGAPRARIQSRLRSTCGSRATSRLHGARAVRRGAGVLRGIRPRLGVPGSPDGRGQTTTPPPTEATALLLAECRSSSTRSAAPTAAHRLHHPPTRPDPQGWDLTKVFASLDFANVRVKRLHGAGSDNSGSPTATGQQANLYT